MLNMLTLSFGAMSNLLELGCSLALDCKVLLVKACKTHTFSALAHPTIQLGEGHIKEITLSYP